MKNVNNKKRRKLELHSRLVFIIYTLLMIYFLFFAENLGRTNGSADIRYNLVLFYEIRRFWYYRDQLGWIAFETNVIGNVLIFIPFGTLLVNMHQHTNHGLLVVLSGFFVSLLVETIQLISHVGSFDVDDILLNTLGALIGCLVGKLIGRCTK